MQQSVAATAVFTGQSWLREACVTYDKTGIITGVHALHEMAEKPLVKNGKLVPAFIDLQVYGTADRLFSAYPHADTLLLMQQNFSKAGTVLFQPTVATNTFEVIFSCIDAVRSYWDGGGSGVLGLHVEGPWIHPLRRGAHLEHLIRKPAQAEVEQLLDRGSGVITMITLAPELFDDRLLHLIEDAGVVISAGHSNADYNQALKAFDSGVRVATHLFNAMPPLHHREPGLAAAILQASHVRSSIIPDGLHVSYPMVQLAARLMGERLFAITDAVAETATGPYQHQFSGDRYEAAGILSGSALTMHQAFKNLITHVGLPIEDALRMCSTTPAEVVSKGHLYGCLKPGARAHFLLLDDENNIAEVITG